MNKAIYMTDNEMPLSRRKAESFGEFVTDIHPSALRFASMLLGSHASVAPDIVQKAFLSAWNKQHQQKDPNKLPAWFRTIILNEVRSYFRWLSVRQRAAKFLGLKYQTAVISQPTDHGLRARLESSLDKLSLKQREVFVLVYLNDLTIPEASDIMGCAPGTAKSHLHRGIHKLRESLGDLWSEQ